ncbi:MAG: DGQHR domain-containing protein [Candidatus Thermoplasmatota archaeon]|nr:DGQHR domain-containing protein [Candidatus Thermoplasmatota archaeon]MCG2827522.1 DGQHR domain-containing protein [Thermoplasmatales archaeon]
MLKNVWKIRKEKDAFTLFEDEIWLLFKKMGFEELNESYNFKINVTPYGSGTKTKQIDVFAKDKDDVFVIECKIGQRSLRKDIAETRDLKDGIEKAIKEHYQERKRVTFIYCTKNIKWSKNDEADAKGTDILVWRDKEISYFKRLAKLIGSSAKYQLFAIIFGKVMLSKPIPGIPTIKGEMGGKVYYLFMIQPKKLLTIACVHHRSPFYIGVTQEDGDIEGNAYQRMLNKGKLRHIDKFITDGGFFANNVIINFTNPPKFISYSKVEGIETGFLELPQYHASAWIVDGQHRLYGYADNPKKSKDMIPVLAFDGLSKDTEGELFVIINKEQKTVDADLLWDLFGDIYENSKDNEKRMYCTISKIIKNLNNGAKSPFHNRIYIPSFNEKEDRLKMAGMCIAIRKAGFVKKTTGLLFREDWEKTENFATRRIETLFNIVKSKLKADWDKGAKGFLCSNEGVAVLIRVFTEIIKYLNYKDPNIINKKTLDEFERESKKLIEPFIDYVDKLGESGRNNLRINATSEGMRGQVANKLMYKIKRYYKDFALNLPPEEYEAKKLVEETELHLRRFIKEKLKEKYNNKWWKQGIPEGVKTYVKKLLEEEIKKAPYKRKEIEDAVEKRLDYTTIGHLKDIIIYSNNWELFKSIFGDTRNVEIKFEGFALYRNVIDHIRKFPDELTKKDSFQALKWVRKCMKLE